MRGEYRGNYTNLWPLMELPPHARRIPTGKALIAENQELPPHARRIRLARCGVNNIHGTTSACAENTGKTDGLKISGRNYLRMRGEYGVSIPPGASFEELPPHARRIPTGKALIAENQELPPHARRILADGILLRLGVGTTSACAENTV